MAGRGVSAQDEAVLNRVFVPELPYCDTVYDTDDDPDSLTSESAPSADVIRARQLEEEGVAAAENGDVISALDAFSRAIGTCPQRPSGYNNRAQALRLTGDVEGALKDLEKALSLSGSDQKVSCQGHTQRGLIRRLQGDEQGALDDFKVAAQLGSDFARKQVIGMNPYAALCNRMLSEVIGKTTRSGPD